MTTAYTSTPHLADEECDAFGVALPDGGEDHADAVLVLCLQVCALKESIIRFTEISGLSATVWGVRL